MKKSQIWFLDFMFGLFIFLGVVVFYYNYYNNISDDKEQVWNEMVIDSKSVSSSLISQGYPEDWNATTAVRIGLMNSNHRMNQTKLDEFAKIEYNTSMILLSTKYDFYFFLEEKNGTKHFPVGREPVNNTFIVQSTRLVIYNSSIHRMVVYLWR